MKGQAIMKSMKDHRVDLSALCPFYMIVSKSWKITCYFDTG